MFFEGDLQSGISLAIQQAKLVVCLVRDSSDESRIWESEWLSDEPLSTLLAEKTVALRLDAGSQEAGFLSAFCPIPKTPALVIIHNGQLKLCLIEGISREDFVSQVVPVLDPSAAQNPAVEGAQDDTTTVQPETVSAAPEDSSFTAIPNEPSSAQPFSAPPAESSQAAPQPSEPESTPEPSPATDINSLFPDRAARLEADYQLTQEAEAAARAAKAAGKRKAVDAEVASSKDPKKLSYAAQEKLRKQAQQSELHRILQRVEADKRERKEREEARRKQREFELREASGAEFAAPSPPAAAQDAARRLSISAASGSRGPAPLSGEVCLRIRLLDGSQIREYFAPSATLAADVRPRVDWALGGDDASATKSPPYSFKHILAPLPNRTLGPAEEARPLGELPDVLPSATLVLVPAKGGVARAYAAAGGIGGGVVGKAWVAVMQLWNLVVMFLAALFGRGAGGRGGGGDARVEQQHQQRQGDRGVKSSARGEGPSQGGIRIRTLRDQGEGADGRNEFYNGNSLDFEPKGENGDDAGK